MKTNNIKLIFYIFFAFIFSVAVRFIWVYNFGHIDEFYWNNELMINTNDGYIFAEGARDIIAGFHQENDLSPINSAISIVTAFLVKILPFSLETIIFYLPIFASSLVVIPIVLIGKSIKNIEAGFIGAILGSTAWSYYNRTMAGYYDTDLLNIVFPTILLWSLIWSLWKKQNIYLVIVAIDIIVYRWWYPASYSLEFGFFGVVALYTIYTYFINGKKLDSIIFNLRLLSVLLVAMSGFDTISKIIGLVIMMLIFVPKRLNKSVYIIFPISILIFILGGGLAPIWSQLLSYVIRDELLSTNSDQLMLHFYSVNQTIREASKISFETFANRISGHSITFIFSIIGYIIMSYRHKIMLLALPMVGLGFLAYVGGLRFTIYAVPIMALSIGYLIVLISNYINTIIVSKYNIVKYLSMTLFCVAILIPNIIHIQNYNVRPVFTKTEVNTLADLYKISSREDYVISWWDYGYPIRYYSDTKTLVDGGKHSGDVNFPVSFMLTYDQQRAAKMARLDVEYTEKGFIDKNNSSNISKMMKDYNQTDPDIFLNSLYDNIMMPKKTRDIYFYLPHRMMQIFSTVNLFSNIDLKSGNSKERNIFSIFLNVKENDRYIYLKETNVVIDKLAGNIIENRKIIPINKFATTMYLSNNKLVKDIKIFHSSKLSVIYMRSYATCIILDEKMYNSLYIQLFVLENYDKKLFEPVILNPLAKIYKLKI